MAFRSSTSLSEEEYFDLLDKLPRENQMLEDGHPDKFVAKMGAEGIYDLLKDLDLDTLSYELRAQSNQEGSQQRKTEALKRLSGCRIIPCFAQPQQARMDGFSTPCLSLLPNSVLSFLLDGGRFATSDLNDLYTVVSSSVTTVSNDSSKSRLPKSFSATRSVCFREAVDSLLDNSCKSSAVKSDANRPLKSLSDSLKGKQGRFRQNLLGKARRLLGTFCHCRRS